MNTFDLQRAAMSIADASPAEKHVLLVLALRADASTAKCTPGVPRIAADTGLSERTVLRAVVALEKAGHIDRDVRPGRGVVYTVHPRHGVTPDKVSALTQCPETPDTVSPKLPRTTIPQKASPSSVKRARAPRTPPMIDPLWIVPDDWRAWATDKLAHWPPGRVAHEADSFADYWRTDPKSRARKISDWSAAWRQWCRNSERFDHERTGSPAPRNAPRSGGRGTVTDAVLAAFDRVSFEG